MMCGQTDHQKGCVNLITIPCLFTSPLKKTLSTTLRKKKFFFVLSLVDLGFLDFLEFFVCFSNKVIQAYSRKPWRKW